MSPRAKDNEMELGYSEVPGLQGTCFKLMRRHESWDSGDRRQSSSDGAIGQTSIGEGRL